MLPFFSCGYFAKCIKTKHERRSLSFILFVIFGAISQSINYINCKYFEPHCIRISDNYYGNYALFYVSAICGIFSVIYLSKFIGKLKPIEYIGSNSMIYFALHQILFILSAKVLNYLNITSAPLLCILWIIIIIAVLLIFTIINEIIMKTPFCVLLGKKYVKSK